VMKKAVELRPDSVAHRINYGVILPEDGKIADARAQWVEALRLDPENAPQGRTFPHTTVIPGGRFRK